jgi:antitoxin ParD1/3/4
MKLKVAFGNYATDSEIVREGLRALNGRNSALEDRLRTEGVGALPRLQAQVRRARRWPKRAPGCF